MSTDSPQKAQLIADALNAYEPPMTWQDGDIVDSPDDRQLTRVRNRGVWRAAAPGAFEFSDSEIELLIAKGDCLIVRQNGKLVK